MAKRSPILGYNHNVRYRGLVWHVQTEDSGMANPHLFTHLFHEGVIVSTRKLVYDNGSDEGAIKSLMQAQHKAVMKDLKRGHFDDKIDVYLAGTPGLLPRGGVEEANTDADSTKPEPKKTPPSMAAVELAPEAMPVLENADPPTFRSDEPLVFSQSPLPTPPIPRTSTMAGTQPAAARTGSQPIAKGVFELDLDEPPAAPIAVKPGKQLATVDSSAEIRLELGTDEDNLDDLEELEVESDESDDSLQADELLAKTLRRRKSHDTEISLSDVPGIVIDDATRKNLVTDGIPNAIAHPERSGGASIPPLPPPPIDRRQPTGDRPSVGAATLPAARAITRPPTSRPTAMPQPTVASRPLAHDPARARSDESDGIEVYSPAPPSVEPPPGASERPGQYAQHRRSSSIAVPTEVIPRDRSASQPIPSGLGKPRTGGLSQPPARQSSDRIPTHPVAPVAPVTPAPVPQPIRPEPSSGGARARTPTPARIPTGPSRPSVAGSGGVVMTRPAVIVGAPAKPATPPRVRKAREEEGRGFGQGLISEKSLDEVILAYLSEDADEK